MPKTTRFLALFLSVSALFSPTTQAAPPPTQYQVELLVFSQLSPQTIASEYWSPGHPPKAANPGAETDLYPVSDDPLATYPILTRLPASAFTLNRAAKRLEKKKNAVILFHEAWRMSRQELRTHRMTIALRNTQTDTLNETDSQPAPEETLSGTISIRLKHYFDTQVELTIAEPNRAIAPYLLDKHSACRDTTTCYFNVDLKRRTRSGVVNYLDHPLYGSLLVIRPVVDADS